MKVKLLLSRAGPSGVQNVGDEIDVSADEGARMIEKGHALLVRTAKPEKAVRGGRKSEKAVR